MDDYQYHKLKRVMCYLRGTLMLPLTLKADRMHVMKSWLDASFVIHHDMRSQTGAAMSLGKGTIYSSSTCQKINRKSSMESELVGMNDTLLQIIWTRYFLEVQGYDIRDSLVFQDNQSTMLLEQNGRGSSCKQTRHISIQYFLSRIGLTQVI